MRRAAAAIAALAGAIAIVLLLCAVFLPADATKHVLELRGRFGSSQILQDRSDAQSIVHELALRSGSGETLSTAWLRRPRALRPDYRIVITYAGRDTGDAILQLIPPKDDLVLVSVQYPWAPPRTIVGKLRVIYDIRQAAYRTIAAGIVAVDIIDRDQHLDPHRILLLGASLGSIFATIHGAIDTRVPQVVLIHGGASLPDTLAAETHDRVPKSVARIAAIPIATFDPARYVARIAPRRLLIIAARDDWRFPPDAVTAFFNRARQPKALRWTNTGHVGKRRREVVAVIMTEVNTYLSTGSDLH